MSLCETNRGNADNCTTRGTKHDGHSNSLLLRRLLDNTPRCDGDREGDQRRNDPRWHGYFVEVERRKSDYLLVVGKALSCDCATAAARRQAVAAAAQATLLLRDIPAIDLMGESGMPFDWRLRRRVEQRREQSLWTVDLAEPWWEELEEGRTPPFDVSKWPIPTLGEARALLRRATRGEEEKEEQGGEAGGGGGAGRKRAAPSEGGVPEMLLRMKEIRSQLSEVDAWTRRPRVMRQRHEESTTRSRDDSSLSPPPSETGRAGRRRSRVPSSPPSSTSSSPTASPQTTPIGKPARARYRRATEESSSSSSPPPPISSRHPSRASSSCSSSSSSPSPRLAPPTCDFRPVHHPSTTTSAFSPPSTSCRSSTCNSPISGGFTGSASAAPSPIGDLCPRRSPMPLLDSSSEPKGGSPPPAATSSSSSSSSCDGRAGVVEEAAGVCGGCRGHHHLDGELKVLRRALSEKEEIIKELQHKLLSGRGEEGPGGAIDPTTPIDVAESTMKAHLAELQGGKEEALPLYEKWLNFYIGHKDYVDPRVLHLRDEAAANESALRAMRSFVPPNIWRMDKRQLAESGLAPALVDRIWTNRALWLIRATRQRWLKGIDVKLLKRTGPGSYDISTLDHVEVRAIYLSIPSDLGPDNGGYRRAYKEVVLERAYGDARCEESRRPRSKKRQALYVEAGERGPFDPDAPNEEFEPEVVSLGAGGDKSVAEIKAERAAELERIRQAKARDRGEAEEQAPSGGGTATTTSSSSAMMTTTTTTTTTRATSQAPPPPPASPALTRPQLPRPPPSSDSSPAAAVSHLDLLRAGRGMLRKSPGPRGVDGEPPLPPPPSPHLEMLKQGRAKLRSVGSAEHHHHHHHHHRGGKPPCTPPPSPSPAAIHLDLLKQGMANLRRGGKTGDESAQDKEEA